MRILAVLINGQFAGKLFYRAAKPLSFVYDPSYLSSPTATPMSVTIPLLGGNHWSESWVDGLLPDSDAIRQEWSNESNAVSPDPLDLLATPLGRDCAGAVQFTPWNEREDFELQNSDFTTLSEGELESILLSLGSISGQLKAPQVASTSTLAGVKRKISLCKEDGDWTFPNRDHPSTHIFKPSNSMSLDSAVNEFICQRAASYVGIPASKANILTIGDQRALVITRHDRIKSCDGKYRRIHQEDLCQALGFTASKMYQSDGGPTPKAIVDLLRNVSSDPDADVRTFLDALIFNCLIINPNAHAKQYSLLLERRAVRLAPLYGLCSMLPFCVPRGPFLFRKTTSAMNVGNGIPFTRQVPPWAWGRAIKSLGLPKKTALERAVDLSGIVPNAIAQAATELPPDLHNHVTATTLVEGSERHAESCARSAWLWSKVQ